MASNVEVQSIKHFEADGDEDSSLKAFATILLLKKIVVRGVKVVSGKNGLFVSMPSRKTKNKERPYYDVVYTPDADLREEIQKAVLSEYKDSMKSVI